MPGDRKMRAVVIEEYGEAETMKVNPQAPVPKLEHGKVGKQYFTTFIFFF